MRYLSVCSGIEAASVAWHDFGWQCVGVSEIDPFACAVLKDRFPTVPNYGDMTLYRDWEIDRGSVDLLVGGTPCQSFSVAGLRRGLDDPRGNLALVYLGMVDRFRPRWIVWENVPGILSTDGGRSFGAFIGGLAELGYGFSWRVLDAQFTRVDGHERAVPQRRRRVFVVGGLGSWRSSAKVLLEPERMRGSDTQGGEARKEATSGGPRCPQGSGEASRVISFDTNQITHQSNRSKPEPGGPSPTLAAEGRAPCVSITPEFADTITAHEQNTYTHEGNVLRLRNVVSHGTPSIRRLTPRECERLQGFPDDWTLVSYRGKPAKDAPRYRAIGNSMAVNVMRWIGRRIKDENEAR